MSSTDARIRPMTADDVPDVDALGMRTLFGDLPGDVDQEARRVWQYGRLGHLVETDPGGAFVLEDGEGVCGVSIALVRERVWGLSLFAIDERMRGRGLGTDLLAAALAYGEANSCEGWIILSSEHPAAMRLYAVSARLDVLPCVAAVGIPVLDQAPPQAARVEDAGAGGVALADAIGREVRGAGHGIDIAAALRFGARLLTFEDRAFALVRDANISLLAARDEEAASAVLWGAWLGAPRGSTTVACFLTGAQQWAIRACLDARLPLSVDSPVMIRGRLGPLAPYVPSGAFL